MIGLQDKAHPGMIQIDAGWQKQSFESTINICPPPPQLQMFAERLINWPNERHSKRSKQFREIADELLAKLGWVYPGMPLDCSFQANSKCRNSELCPEACQKHCKQMDRPLRDSGFQRIYGGLICSSSKVIKDASYRDKVVAINNREGKAQILAFETEGYGIASQIQCLNIRGISDYSDSHKNNRWQPYAAVNAAAAAKIITHLLVEQLSESHTDHDLDSPLSNYTQSSILRNTEGQDPNSRFGRPWISKGVSDLQSDEEAALKCGSSMRRQPILYDRPWSHNAFGSDNLEKLDSQASRELQEQYYQTTPPAKSSVPISSNQASDVVVHERREASPSPVHNSAYTNSTRAGSASTQDTESSLTGSLSNTEVYNKVSTWKWYRD